VNDSNRRGVRQDETGPSERLRRRNPIEDDTRSLEDDGDTVLPASGSEPRAERQIPRQDRRAVETFGHRFGWDEDPVPDEIDAPRLADGMDPEEDESTSSRRSLVATIVFFFLMATIGSGGAAIWYYYGPESVPHSTQIDETAQTLARLADEQRKLTQSIAALQLLQDSLQKHILAGEQELQRLTTEVRSLRSDVEQLRTPPAGAAGHSGNAQTPRSSNRAPAKKNKTEAKPTAEPKGHAGPLTVSPQPQ